MAAIEHLRKLTNAEVWKENTRARDAGDADGLSDTAMVLLSRTDMSPEACERSKAACAERAAAARKLGSFEEVPEPA